MTTSMYSTLEQIVNAINGGSGAEYFGGTDTRSAEQIAADYAVDAAADMEHKEKESGFSFEEIDPHFNTLVESGANFDYTEAMEIAQSK